MPLNVLVAPGPLEVTAVAKMLEVVTVFEYVSGVLDDEDGELLVRFPTIKRSS